VTGDLTRSRLTVFFRLLLAIPHFIWFGLWGIFAAIGAFANWVIALFTGRAHQGLFRFLTAYINYMTHVYAYVSVAAGPYPGFTGDPGYVVDIVFDPPVRQNRWSILFRLILAIPALILIGVLVGFGGGGGGTSRYQSTSGSSTDQTYAAANVFGVVLFAGIVAWFYALFRARAPEGVQRLILYALHYAAQAWSYVFVLTDRYPNSDPELVGVPRPPPPHPITLTRPDDELERSRLTVFFRLLLAFPHIVWLALWTLLVVLVGFVNWLVTLVRGRSPESLHNFLASYQRYGTHVQAFVSLVANPFPGFTGAPGSYPVDLQIAPPERQRRVVTAFRFLVAIPAFMIQSGLNVALYAVAVLGWFASLFTGRMPRGLRNLGAFVLRYGAQTSAYGYLLLTDRYPYAGPPA
jgi:hypothetical protein